MTIIVTDTGFAPDTWTQGFTPLAEADSDSIAIEVAPADSVETLLADHPAVQIIRITFPSFADGRGFTPARRLRALGYTGRLRAAGHLIADQYAMARRSGCDEVEISDDLAARQPQEQWVFRADWQDHDYQRRLRA